MTPAPDGRPLPSGPSHRVVAADAWSVPKPFTRFAVRSEEPRHADAARTPYPRVHIVRTGVFDGAAAVAVDELAADARSRMACGNAAFGSAPFDIAPFDLVHAQVTPPALAAASPSVPRLIDTLAAALQATAVLGADAAGYRRNLATRIDYLATRGAGFHNDVSCHWTACLFWNLVIVAADVECVMPHAGVRLALQPGDLIVFDPTMAHGLCRPGDHAQAVSASFETGADRQDADGRQLFLTGELPLTDAQWAALGAPWLRVDDPAHSGALDLLAAEFDERSGAIKSLRAMAQCMSPDVPDAVA